MYLLDTNILSHLLAPAPAPGLVRRFSETPDRDLYTSSINRAELLYGLLRLKKSRLYLARLERLFDTVKTLSFDSHCADIYGELRVELEKVGTPLPDSDLMIACVALANELIVVTGNERHFLRIPGLEVENWLREP